MVSTGKRRQQNQKLLSFLVQTADDFTIGKTCKNMEDSIVLGRGDENFECLNLSHLMTESRFKHKMRTLKKNISDKVWTEKKMLLSHLKKRCMMHFAMDELVISRMELAMRSVDNSSKRNPTILVIDLD